MKKKLLFLIPLSCFLLLFNLPYFALRTISVSPLNFLNEQDMQDMLIEFNGQNVFKLLVLSAVENEVLGIKQVKHVDLSYHFPDSFHVHILEKDPWLSCMSDGKTTLLSRDGVVLSRGDFSIQNPEELLVVKGMSDYFFESDEISDSLLTQLQDIESLMNRYYSKDSVLLEQDAYQSWHLLLYNQLLIKLGTLENLDDKFLRLNHYLSLIDKENYSTINYIDLRLENKLLVNK